MILFDSEPDCDMLFVMQFHPEIFNSSLSESLGCFSSSLAARRLYIVHQRVKPTIHYALYLPMYPKEMEASHTRTLSSHHLTHMHTSTLLLFRLNK